jgi:MATE family multidrug resistance protein
MGAGGLGIASTAMWSQAIVSLYLRRARRFADLGLFARFDPPHWPAIRGLLATDSRSVAWGRQPVHRHRAADRAPGDARRRHQIAINVASLSCRRPGRATTVRVGHALDAAAAKIAPFAGYALALARRRVRRCAVFGRHALVAL